MYGPIIQKHRSVPLRLHALMDFSMHAYLPHMCSPLAHIHVAPFQCRHFRRTHPREEREFEVRRIDRQQSVKRLVHGANDQLGLIPLEWINQALLQLWPGYPCEWVAVNVPIRNGRLEDRRALIDCVPSHARRRPISSRNDPADFARLDGVKAPGGEMRHPVPIQGGLVVSASAINDFPAIQPGLRILAERGGFVIEGVGGRREELGVFVVIQYAELDELFYLSS
ncbi:hypothetical protein SAMN05216189_105326 [Pseudomonas delhiensis]|uniref:Uncharacterized protein n=1 Tax=Pseudomonas delhiensis TaxID=366289 RepID=A0A239NL16_9PSED|nr:hypothetical protein SAMN05216189_105326 [Pseudomonas delhiensis]SNT55048.1 hypothetical protein SAMN06295949_15012 [Pseudomonas delhiensis]